MIVDAHCHVSLKWYEPVDTLLFQMDRCGVERACLVQMLGEFDNSYQSACVARHPDRLMSIAGIDAGADDALTKVQSAIDVGARGLRLRPDMRSKGDDPLAIWRMAEQAGLPVSCVGPATSFVAAAFAALVESVPRLKIVLEHLGGLARPDFDRSEHVLTHVLALARYPNLLLKVPGLGQLQARKARMPIDGSPYEDDGLSLLARALDAFGADRLMWGSDFPPVSSREGYANALAGPRRQFSDLPAEQQDAIFGGTALATFWH